MVIAEYWSVGAGSSPQGPHSHRFSLDFTGGAFQTNQPLCLSDRLSRALFHVQRKI